MMPAMSHINAVFQFSSIHLKKRAQSDISFVIDTVASTRPAADDFPFSNPPLTENDASVSFTSNGSTPSKSKLTINYPIFSPFAIWNFPYPDFVYTFGNPIAAHCYEKIGFQREGLLRQHAFDGQRYHDVVIMGYLKGNG